VEVGVKQKSEKTSREREYEHKNIYVLVEENSGSDTRLHLHKRDLDDNDDSHWDGSLEEIRELSEAVFATLLVCSSPTETLNAGEQLPAQSAEPPRPGAGDMVVQMTVERFREILDTSNEILKDAAERSHDLPKMVNAGCKLATLVNDVLGGESCR
jgi:hypothetical protein